MPARLTAQHSRAMPYVIALLISVVVFVLARPAMAQGVKGEASVAVTGGYGRIVIRLATEVEAKVRLSGGILIVQFKEPVDVPVDRITTGATEYIGAARRDPDGRGLRFALMQKVRISSMAAGERLFIDLLPESWTFTFCMSANRNARPSGSRRAAPM